MKILFCVPRIHTNYSGMIEGLLNDGHNLTFITMTENEITVCLNSDIPIYQFEPKERFFISKYRTKQLHFENFCTLNGILKREQPDLIIVRDFRILNLQISLLAKLKVIPVILYDQVPVNYNKTFKRKVWYTATRLLISKYRMTTVKQQIEVNVGKNSTTFFIPFAVSKTIIKKNYPNVISSDNPLKIIVISKLDSKRKNLIFLIDSLSLLMKKNLVQISLYGMLRDTPESQDIYNKLREFIISNQLSDQISLFPNEIHHNVLQAYSNHDLFILPSLNEPAAISPFEAMSSGLPVIITEQNGTNYIVEENTNGFIINPRSKNELINSVLFFIENPEKIKEYGVNSFNLINKYYRPDNFSKNITQIIKSIIE